MKKHFLLIILFLGANYIFAQTKHTITKSSVSFQIKNLGINMGGVFGAVKGDIQFDPAHLDASSIIASIDANTISTDNDTRDEHLKSDSFFDVVKYPKIAIKSVSFKHRSGNNYTGTFNLTIKDKTNPVSIPFSYTQTGNIAEFKGTLKIHRTDYNVGESSMVMSDDVTISIDVMATK